MRARPMVTGHRRQAADDCGVEVRRREVGKCAVVGSQAMAE